MFGLEEDRNEVFDDAPIPEGLLVGLDELVTNPAATFYFRCSSQAMTQDGIFRGDILMVDRSREAVNGDIVIASIDGRYFVRRLLYCRGRPILFPSERRFPLIDLFNRGDIWGVVSNIVHEKNNIFP